MFLSRFWSTRSRGNKYIWTGSKTLKTTGLALIRGLSKTYSRMYSKNFVIRAKVSFTAVSFVLRAICVVIIAFFILWLGTTLSSRHFASATIQVSVCFISGAHDAGLRRIEWWIVHLGFAVSTLYRPGTSFSRNRAPWTWIKIQSRRKAENH